jgi:deoxycytidine triphosphate deaminase
MPERDIQRDLDWRRGELEAEKAGIIGVDNFHPSPLAMERALNEAPYRQDVVEFMRGHGRNLKELFYWPKHGNGELTDIGILRHMIAGNITIQPFHIELLQSNGYDVRLGKQYWELTDPAVRGEARGHRYDKFSHEDKVFPIINPLDQTTIQDAWHGPLDAVPLRQYQDQRLAAGKAVPAKEWVYNRFLIGLEPDDEVIILPPLHMILGHTIEFIGGRNIIDTTISGKSTSGRIGIETCSDADKGDIGYRLRWTLEIVNKFPDSAIPLVVGQPYATVTFIQVDPPAQHYAGSYQSEESIEVLIQSWKPELMLPIMRRRSFKD